MSCSPLLAKGGRGSETTTNRNRLSSPMRQQEESKSADRAASIHAMAPSHFSSNSFWTFVSSFNSWIHDTPRPSPSPSFNTRRRLHERFIESQKAPHVIREKRIEEYRMTDTREKKGERGERGDSIKHKNVLLLLSLFYKTI